MLRRHRYVIILFVSFLISLTHIVNGQTIENLYLEQAGSKIIIHYEFDAENTDNTYQLKVYHSIDGFTNPINLIKGDVGDRVRPGSGKVIEWYAREEIGTFKGELIVEIRIFQSPENIYLQNPAMSSKLKRGSALNINWSGGINEDKVSIQLMKNGQQVESIANNIDNTGSFSWVSPSKIKPGKGYVVQITGSSTRGIQSTSSNFSINRKIPMWLIIAPAAVLVGTVAILVSSGAGGDENNDLPGAPDPN